MKKAVIISVLIIYIILLVLISVISVWYDRRRKPVKVMDNEDKVFEQIDISMQESEPIIDLNTGEAKLQFNTQPLVGIYEEWKDLLEKGNYGGFDQEFIHQRAEGFIDNTLEWYGVNFGGFDVLPKRRLERTQTRINEAMNSGTTKKEKLSNFHKNSITHTSDTQNVHDSSVNKGLRNTYKKIVRKNKENKENDTIDDIIMAAHASPKSDKIIPVIEKMQLRLPIAAIKDHEENILLNVWNRSYHPSNSDNAQNIRESVLDQLADCWEDGSIVCGSGRTGRVIGALAIIDSDSAMGNTMTSEAYRNEVFNKAQKSLNRVIIKFKKMTGDYKKYAETFETGADDTEISKKVKLSFKKEVMKDIDIYINKHKDVLKPSVRDEIIMGLDLLG